MKVYSSPNLTMVGHMKQVLDSHDIASEIRREFMGAAIGVAPPIECWPELWVAEESHFEQAMAIIKEATESAEGDIASWKCAKCDEELEGQFTVCWKCGTERADEGGS